LTPFQQKTPSGNIKNPTAMEQERFTVGHCLGDPDELGDVARAWDVDIRQIDRGALV